MKASLSTLAALGLALSISIPAAAQNSSAVNSAKIEVLERQVRMLRSRLGLSNQPVQDSQAAAPANPQLMADLSAKIGSLESQMRRLNGRLEEFEFRQRQTLDEIEVLRKELEFQRQEMTRVTTAQPTTATSPVEGQPVTPPADGGETLAPVEAPAAPTVEVELPDGDAAQQFDYAFAFVRKNDLQSGQAAFEKFIAANPGDTRIGNAKYWLGRIHAQEGRNAQAAQLLLSLIEEHPNHDKRPDALVDLADVLLKLDSASDACNALAEFRRVADKASTRLQARADRVSASARCS